MKAPPARHCTTATGLNPAGMLWLDGRSATCGAGNPSGGQARARASAGTPATVAPPAAVPPAPGEALALAAPELAAVPVLAEAEPAAVPLVWPAAVSWAAPDAPAHAASAAVLTRASVTSSECLKIMRAVAFMASLIPGQLSLRRPDGQSGSTRYAECASAPAIRSKADGAVASA
jgi:hypothetical protein